MSSPAALRQPARRALWALIAVGVVARLIVAFATFGSRYDMRSFLLVTHELTTHPLHVYGNVNHLLHAAGLTTTLFRWPYPPAFFPWLLASDGLGTFTGLPFHGLVQVPAILADAGIAWLVQRALGSAGAGERTRLGAAALVMLGPSFLVISGYHGQFDSLAILPAVAALLIWEDPERRRRALLAGLLIGVGGALKTVPLLMALALLPSARSVREGLTLAAVAAAVPLAMLVPFALVDLGGVAGIGGYSGAPGLGGLSLVLQPGLAGQWLTGAPLHPTGLSQVLLQRGSLLTGAALVLVGAVLLRYRPRPRDAAVLVWLAVYVFGSGFFFQYLVWGLPFILLAGYLRPAAYLQAAALVPTLLFYLGPWATTRAAVAYVPLMVLVWLGLAAGFVVLLRMVVLDARHAGGSPGRRGASSPGGA